MGLTSQNRFFLFWSILGAIALLVIWHLPWRFQVNDDEVMMWLVSGAYTGTPETYAVFIHPALSWTFAQLYTFSPETNWYGGTWFWVNGISYLLLLGKTTIWKTDLWTKRALATLILLTSIHFAFFPQFTIVAGFAAFASISIWFSLEQNKSPFLISLSLLLFVSSILIRWESVALIGLGFGLYKLAVLGIAFFRVELRKILVFALLFLTFFGSKWYWEAKSDYVDFLKFNKIRSGVIDHPVFHQEIVGGEVSPESDFYFFSRWYFEADFPSETELMEKKQALDSKLLSGEQFYNSLFRFWRFQKTEAFKSFLIGCIVVLFLFSAKKSPKLYRFFLIWGLFFLLFNYFFLLQGRVVILFFLCFLFPVGMDPPTNIPTKLAKFSMVIFLGVFLFHSYNFGKEAKGRGIMDHEFTFLKSGVKSNVPIILEGFQEHNSEIEYTLNNQVPFLTTGWISRSPFQKKALARFGFQSFEQIEEYVLITPSTNLEIVFPSYMDFTFGDFQLMDSQNTENFIFLQFSKK